MSITSSLTPASQAFLSLAFPPNSPLQRDIPIDTGRINMETAIRKYGGPPPSVRRVEDVSTKTLDGTASIPLRIYWPKIVPAESEEKLKFPVLLYAHGGGWVKGNLNTHDNLCRRIAVGSSHVVVAVDYRLSPEVRYPAALDDVEAAFKFIQTQPQLDPTQVTVAGDSAGGNLVAALVVRLLNKTEDELKIHHRVKRQVLIYPVVDMRMQGPSYETYGSGFGLSKVSIEYYIESYLGPGYPSSLTHTPEVSPILFERPQELPATLILTAEADPFASEAEALTEKLEEAKVPVRHVIYRGVVHAYLTYFDLFPEEGVKSVKEIVGFLKEHTL